MTQTAQHTPAPWTYAKHWKEGFMIRTERLDRIAVTQYAEPGVEEANARLIAAAPELLDALEDLVGRDETEARECGLTDDEMTWLEDARRAIASAKGGAS